MHVQKYHPILPIIFNIKSSNQICALITHKSSESNIPVIEFTLSRRRWLEDCIIVVVARI